MMSTEQELKDLITQIDRKIDNNHAEIKSAIATVDTKIALVDKDLTWLKWLFGILSSLIVVLLSALLSIAFKLLGG